MVIANLQITSVEVFYTQKGVTARIPKLMVEINAKPN